jgi:hypothetical protein
MSKLRRLSKKVDKLRIALYSAIDDVATEVSKISGVENIVCNDLANDGLGVRIDEDDNGDTHVGISDLIEVLEKTGTITRKDLESTFL